MDSLVRADLADYAPASNLSFNEKIRNLMKGGKTVYHFAFGQSPFPVIETAVEALKEHAGENAYLPVAGLPELREAISQFHKIYDGIQSDPEDIIVGPGSKELVFLLLNIFQGDVILISPSWTTYKPQAKLSHHKPYVIETSIEDDWKITPKSVEAVRFIYDFEDSAVELLFHDTSFNADIDDVLQKCSSPIPNNPSSEDSKTVDNNTHQLPDSPVITYKYNELQISGPDLGRPVDELPVSDGGQPVDELAVPDGHKPVNELAVANLNQAIDELPVPDGGQPVNEPPVPENGGQAVDELPVPNLNQPVDEYTLPDGGQPVGELPVPYLNQPVGEHTLPDGGQPVDELPVPNLNQPVDEYTLPDGGQPVGELPVPYLNQPVGEHTLPDGGQPVDELPVPNLNQPVDEYTLPDGGQPVGELPVPYLNQPVGEHTLPDGGQPVDELPVPNLNQPVDEHTLPDGGQPVGELPVPNLNQPVDEYTLPDGGQPVGEQPVPDGGPPVNEPPVHDGVPPVYVLPGPDGGQSVDALPVPVVGQPVDELPVSDGGKQGDDLGVMGSKPVDQPLMSYSAGTHVLVLHGTQNIPAVLLDTNNLQKNKILILNNPDNPTGTSYTESELIALSEVFRQNDIIVLSDEIYGRLSFDQNHASIAKYYPERTIISTGLSKWASAGGWRIGYHIYPPGLSSLRKAVRSAASHTYSCAPAPMQYAAVKMFSDLEACDEYIKHCSRILKAVGTYCYDELTSVGVKAVLPKAGYYMFPDFEVAHNKLRQRGLETGQDMCDVIFEETSVALMSGGPAFLRPDDELTTRLCFVPFDGTRALDASRQVGLDKSLPSSFVQKYCGPVYDGIQILKSWVVKNS